LERPIDEGISLMQAEAGLTMIGVRGDAGGASVGGSPGPLNGATVSVMDMQLNGIVSSRMRHVIKRYLRRIGLRDIKVVHLHDSGPSTLRLVVTGLILRGLTSEQLDKIRFLNESLRSTLSMPVDGMIPHPSNANPEILREKLSKVEPSMRRVFYTRA
jgi:hypothetical protein